MSSWWAHLEHVGLSPAIAAGQRVDLEPTAGPSTVTITVDGVVVPDQTLGPALAAVGFAEVGTGLAPTVEVVRPPADAVDAMTAAGPDVPAVPYNHVLEDWFMVSPEKIVEGIRKLAAY